MRLPGVHMWPGDSRADSQLTRLGHRTRQGQDSVRIQNVTNFFFPFGQAKVNPSSRSSSTMPTHHKVMIHIYLAFIIVNDASFLFCSIRARKQKSRRQSKNDELQMDGVAT